MNTRIVLLTLALGISACSHIDRVQYDPNPTSQNPKATIERVLKEQPPSWGDVPLSVEVKADCIEMNVLQTDGPPGYPMFQNSYQAPKSIYFKNVGKTILHRHTSGVWYVEIIDRLGQWIHSVNCYDEADAKAFIDALFTMKKNAGS